MDELRVVDLSQKTDRVNDDANRLGLSTPLAGISTQDHRRMYRIIEMYTKETLRKLVE